MQVTTVTSKGQVTIPKSVRQQLGICQGSQIEFVVMGDKVELRCLLILTLQHGQSIHDRARYECLSALLH